MRESDIRCSMARSLGGAFLSVMALAAVLVSGCASQSGTVDLPVRDADEARGGSALVSHIDFAKVERKREKFRDNGPKRMDKPQEALDYFLEQRLAPGMRVYPIERVQRIARDLRDARPAPGGVGVAGQPEMALPGGLDAWREIGPGNIGGRTRAIVINPDNPDIIYAAGVAGGVFKTIDDGQTWNPTSDFLSNIAFSTLAMDPTNPDVIYGGTGEGFFNGDSVRGLGIFKTTDGGQTWTQLESTVNSDPDDPDAVPFGAFFYVNKIQVSPTNPSRVYAATRFGVWRSLDAGESWEFVLGNTNAVDPGVALNDAGFSFAGATDLQIRTDQSPDVLFAAFGSFTQDGLYRSTNGGTTWQKVGTGGTLDRPDQGRMTIAIAPSDQDVVYVAMADNDGAMIDVFRSEDGGLSWSPRLDQGDQFSPLLFSNVPFGNGCFGNGSFAQGWYDNIVAVDPTDPDVVWIGGVDLFRSDDGGSTFGLASYWFFDAQDPNFVHADQHEIVFHPDYNGSTNQIMYVGNDGGVFRTDNALADTSINGCPRDSSEPLPEIAWQSLNNGYGVTQYYHGDVSKQNDVFIGGTQDNGTSRVTSTDTPNAWEMILGGDGGYVQINPLDDSIVYAEFQGFPTIRKSTDGGDSFERATDGIEDTDGLFITPFAMDPSSPNILWTGGTRAWRTLNAADSWDRVSEDFEDPDTGLNPSRISAIAVAPSNSSRVYLGFSDGYVATTNNALIGEPEWTIRDQGLPIEFGFISDLAVDPIDPDIAYATTSTFNVAHVYRTTDGGETWSSIDGIQDALIPDIPAHSIAISPTDRDTLYLGTEVGVFASLDAGQTWQPASTGLPTTVVEELVFQNDDTLVAFTHGRGVFITDQPPCPGDLTGPGGDGEPDGTVDANDFFFYLSLFSAGDSAADLTGPTGNPDGIIDANDFFAYLGLFSQGCP